MLPVFVLACVSFLTAYLVRFDFDVPDRWFAQCVRLMLGAGVIKVCAYYPLRSSIMSGRHFGPPNVVAIFGYAAICAALIAGLSWISLSLHVPRGVIAIDFLLTSIMIGGLRMAQRAFSERIDFLTRDAKSGLRRAVIFGSNDAAALLISETLQDPESDVVFEAVFHEDGRRGHSSLHGVPVKGGLEDMRPYLNSRRIDLVVLAVPSPTREQMSRFNEMLVELNVPVKVLRPLLDVVDSSPAIEALSESGTFRLMSTEHMEVKVEPAAKSAPGLIPVANPTLPEIEDVLKVVKESYDTGHVTTGGVVRLFQEEVQKFTQVRHAVAVSSCTSGLILALGAMDYPEGAEVIVPSFTFAATVQALFWNRLTPVFVDCLDGTMTMDPDEVAKAIGPKTVAIYPVTVFGLPPDVSRMEELAHEHGLALIFDSAQGLGSTYRGRPAGGFGLCEAFSLSPGKVITAMEGGLVTTNNDELAAKLTSMRDYGKGPDGQEMIFKGLSARMVEFDAAVGLLNLKRADKLIAARLRLIETYRRRLEKLPGCRPQVFPEDRTTSGSLFAFRIEEPAKVDRDSLFEALRTNDIQSKKYFYPPVHAQRVVANKPHRIVGDLKNTWRCSLECLALPLYSHMTEEDQERVCSVVESVMQG